MGLTVTTLVKRQPLGDRWLTVSSVVPDSSFASGGEALTRLTLGFQSVADAEFAVWFTGSVGGYTYEYDYANQKLLAYMQSDSDNDVPLVAATSADLSLLTVIVFALGRYTA